MATKYFCDRCDNSYSDSDSLISLCVPIFSQYQHNLKEWNVKKIDLCASCTRALNDFIKPLPKQG